MTINDEPVGTARNHLGVLAQEAGVSQEVTVLTIHGRAVAAIVHLGITQDQLEEVRAHARGIAG